MRSPFATAVALLSLLVLGGCASGSAGAMASRARSDSHALASVESMDPRLSAALLAERILPTAEAALQVSREYARLGILDAAHTSTKRALARAPRLPAAHEMMARIWRDWGMPDAALVHAHRAIHYGPASAAAYNTLGTVLDALGKRADARVAFQKAFTLDATAGWALSNLCYLEFRDGNLPEARRQCEAAIKASPTLDAAHNNLGLAHAAAGDLERARDAFLAGGDAAAADYNIGVVHLAAGRYAEAAAAFGRAAEERPAFTAAKERAHEARIRVLRAEDRKQP